MVRLRAVLLERDERAALQALGELGLLHLIRGRPGPDTAPLEPPPADPARAPWDRLLERAEGLRLALGVPPHPPLSMTDPEESLSAMEARAKELLDRREGLRRHHKEASDLARHLGGYLGLGIPLDRIGTGSFLQLMVGTLPEERLEEVQEHLGGQALLLAQPAQERRLPLVALCARGEWSRLDRILREAGFQEAPLPQGGAGGLDDFIQGIRQTADSDEAGVTRLETEIEAFSEEIAGPLAGLEERIRLEQGLLEAGEHFPRTASTLLLQGWIPAADAPLLEERLRAATGACCALEIRPPGAEEEAQVPVLLRPSPLLRPFEKLVGNYGLPRYLELSPTPFVAISYLLMFGMMFGDVGHGLVLALVGLLAWRKWPDAGLLLLGGGLASALSGAVYGSCFGLAQFKPFALWHDPLEGDPIHLMSLAIGLGVLMISLGLVLNILNHFRRRDVPGALMGRFGLAGLLFYWGALGLLLWRGPLPSALPTLLLIPVLAWVLHARHGGLTDALVEAFETLLVFLANTISFVRLAAYAMSHAALLAATLLMADAVGPSFSWLVLLLGNLAAILLEGVIASVQALRLEYYEFFGKFFSGAGRPFAPFRLPMKEGEA